MASDPTPSATPSGGVHLSRGVGLCIPAGGLTISFNARGELSAQINELHLQFNTCTEWLDIAFEHLQQADQEHRQLMAAHQSGSDISSHMQSEFRSSMQAAVAAATFFEALYAATRDCLPQDRSAPRPVGRRKAARSAHVTEQLKRAFGLKQHGTSNLGSVLSEIYRFRDEAVHPASSFGLPARHPDLGLIVERRFAMYTCANAHPLVRAALAYCEILPKVAQGQGPKEVQPLARYLLESGEPLFQAWRSSYGALRDDDPRP